MTALHSQEILFAGNAALLRTSVVMTNFLSTEIIYQILRKSHCTTLITLAVVIETPILYSVSP